MDREQPSLVLLNPGATIRVLHHASDPSRSRFGSGAEQLVLAAPPGESAQAAYRLPQAPILSELTVSAWLRANRPGTRLAGLVVLPRSLAPSGQPRRLLVFGDEIAGADEWVRLSLRNLGPALERQSRIVRSEGADRSSPHAQIDEREAYLESLVFLCPGGTGPTELLVDQITLHGVVRDSRRVTETGTEPVGNAAPQPPLPPLPLAPRVIQWQGESFALLRELGFDAAALGRLPTSEERRAARRTGLYLVCPPPREESGVVIDPSFDIVMAWDLGTAAAEPLAVEDMRGWAEWLKRTDPQRSRPTLLRPATQVREASRLSDAIVLDRPTIGSSLSLAAFSTWMMHQQRVARPGTPVWATIDTHHAGRLAAQLAAMQSGRAPVVPAHYADMFRWCAATFPSRPTGFYFRSEASLAAADRGNRVRALAAELLNERIALVQPWLARGKQVAAARSSRDDVTAIVLQTERSHLIVPMIWDESGRSEPITAERPLALVLPGVPESSEPYLLGGVSARRLRSQRVAGGLRITVEDLPRDGLILLTEDGQAYTQIERRLRGGAQRTVDLRIQMVELKRQQAAEALGLLPQPLVAAAEVQGVLHRIAALTKSTQDSLTARDFHAAYDSTVEADAALDLLERRTVERVAGVQEPGTSPLPLRWEAAPDHVRLAAAIARSAGPWRPLPGGEFENLAELLQQGWRHLEYPLPGVATGVRLSPEAPYQGQFCLELEARSVRSDAALATPIVPVWITSPEVVLPADSLLEVTGMFRSTEPLLGPDEALLAFDSLGGEALALRLKQAPQWRPFRLARLTGAGGETRLTFALDGLGRVEIDSLNYRIIPLGAAASGGTAPVRLEARTPAGTPR
ncbi:MAG: hypothetical protein KF847_05170 [Pirellulales bacterium]|nr:hypothetical protein [Pirellulales bacterium]